MTDEQILRAQALSMAIQAVGTGAEPGAYTAAAEEFYIFLTAHS